MWRKYWKLCVCIHWISLFKTNPMSPYTSFFNYSSHERYLVGHYQYDLCTVYHKPIILFHVTLVHTYNPDLLPEVLIGRTKTMIYVFGEKLTSDGSCWMVFEPLFTRVNRSILEVSQPFPFYKYIYTDLLQVYFAMSMIRES